jgi:hypothetical protein
MRGVSDSGVHPFLVTIMGRNPWPGGFRPGDLHSGGWKIDLWAMQAEELGIRLLHEERLAARLTEESREAIIGIKQQMWTHPEYRKSITSQDIYRAVLDAGVVDLEGFWRFLKRMKETRRA